MLNFIGNMVETAVSPWHGFWKNMTYVMMNNLQVRTNNPYGNLWIFSSFISFSQCCVNILNKRD